MKRYEAAWKALKSSCLQRETWTRQDLLHFIESLEIAYGLEVFSPLSSFKED